MSICVHLVNRGSNSNIHSPDPLRSTFPRAMLTVEKFTMADHNQRARRHCSTSGADGLGSARMRARRASSVTRHCLLNRLSCRLKTALNPLKINRMQFWNRHSNGWFQRVPCAGKIGRPQGRAATKPKEVTTRRGAKLLEGEIYREARRTAAVARRGTELTRILRIAGSQSVMAASFLRPAFEL